MDEEKTEDAGVERSAEDEIGLSIADLRMDARKLRARVKALKAIAACGRIGIRQRFRWTAKLVHSREIMYCLEDAECPFNRTEISISSLPDTGGIGLDGSPIRNAGETRMEGNFYIADDGWKGSEWMGGFCGCFDDGTDPWRSSPLILDDPSVSKIEAMLCWAKSWAEKHFDERLEWYLEGLGRIADGYDEEADRREKEKEKKDVR